VKLRTGLGAPQEQIAASMMKKKRKQGGESAVDYADQDMKRLTTK